MLFSSAVQLKPNVRYGLNKMKPPLSENKVQSGWFHFLNDRPVWKSEVKSKHAGKGKSHSRKILPKSLLITLKILRKISMAYWKMKKGSKPSKIFLFSLSGILIPLSPRRLNFTLMKDKRNKQFLNPVRLERLDLNQSG